MSFCTTPQFKEHDFLFFREAMLAEMGVAIGVDGHTVGLFQPKKVLLLSHFIYSFVIISDKMCLCIGVWWYGSGC